MMNLSEFLFFVDEICGSATKEMLSDFIHEAARNLPSSERASFLNMLRLQAGSGSSLTETGRQEDFSARYERIKGGLTEIEDGDLELEGSLNEEYDDWYNSDEDEFLYKDPSGIGQMICEACVFLSECVECGEYALGNDIAEILLDLEIQIGGEYLDYADHPMGVDELSEHGIADINYDEMLVCALHAAYCSFPLEDRSDVLYHMILSVKSRAVTLEKVMQNGPELPEFDAFLKLWISYLGNNSGYRAQQLLEEAVELANDPDVFLETARICSDIHPGLYEKYLESRLSSDTDAQLCAVGTEALEAIDTKYTVRSRVALLLLPVLQRMGDWKMWDICLLESFRSDSTVKNYMRLIMQCRDFTGYKSEIARISGNIYQKADLNRYYYVSEKDELQENKVVSDTAYMLAFLQGKFDFVLNQGMNVKEALGWSGTFMKCGLAVFLLLLLENETLSEGGAEMCRMVDSSMGFTASGKPIDVVNAGRHGCEGEFWSSFLFWKKSIKITSDKKMSLLERMERLIALRVQGIMDANRRNYYGECAAYVAAMGEVKESRGESDGKQKFMQEYRAQYSRRSAFHRELKNYGMR